MSYEVLARKYRPTNFEEVVGQDHIIKALVNSIDQKKNTSGLYFFRYKRRRQNNYCKNSS